MAADSFVAAHLRAAADVARATSGGVFVPGEGDLPDLRAALSGLDQAGLDTVAVVWTTKRAELERGTSVRVGPSLVWPLRMNGAVVALVYLERAALGFPSLDDEKHGRLIAERIRVAASPSAGVRAAREAPLGEDQRRLLDVILRQTSGNVSAAADLLGWHRDTVYYWISKLGLRLEDYRPLRRPRRRS